MEKLKKLSKHEHWDQFSQDHHDDDELVKLLLVRLEAINLSL